MKNSILALTLLVSSLCLSACTTNTDAPDVSTPDTTSSITTNQTSTTTKSSSTTMKTTSPSSSQDDTPAETTINRPSSNYESWTFNDWINASDEQRAECLKFFSKEVGRETDESNLGKIFATNQDKNLTQIIVIQKSNSNTQSGVQQDPGHGAAAGY